MPISVGDTFPDVRVKIPEGGAFTDTQTGELFAGKKAVLFAVPGAFTPTCSDSHLPGFVTQADALRAKGVDLIACTAVNDAFVLAAWAKDRGSEGKVTMLADGNGDLARALGLELDGSGFGMGMRSQRYAAVIDNGVVTSLHLEENPGEVRLTGADSILEAL